MREIYICASGDDFAQEQRLRKGLQPALQRFDLALWGRRDIISGTVWKDEMKKHLARADFFVVLVSTDCLADNMCNVEIQAAQYQVQHSGLKVIPIHLRRTAFFDLTDLALFPALPKSGKAVSHYRNADEAWADVLRDLIEMISVTHRYIA